MVLTTYARERIALLLGSNLPDEHIQNYGVGAGSGTVDVSNVTLVDEKLRFAITGSPNLINLRQASFRGDLNSNQASGLDLFEHGLFNVSGTAFPGSTLVRNQLAGSIVGDGSIEFKFETIIEVN